MDYEQILLELKDHIALLTLNRPDIRNAITDPAMIEEMLDAFEKVQKDEDARVLILTGAGSAFSAGGNIKDMYERKGMFEGDPEQIRMNYRNGIQKIPLALHRLDVPTLAAVNGPAMGAGCDLACMCDIRIAGETARFGETFVSLGLIPGDGGAYFMPRAVGFSKACELAFTCRVIDAQEALQIGLVSEITPQGKLLERSMEIASEIADQPGRTLRMAKRLFNLCRGKSLEETLEISAAYQAICHHSPEHTAALEAFLAKRRTR